MAEKAQEADAIEPLRSVAEVAGVLGVAELTLHRLVGRGELERVKIGRRTLFDRAGEARCSFLTGAITPVLGAMATPFGALE